MIITRYEFLYNSHFTKILFSLFNPYFNSPLQNFPSWLIINIQAYAYSNRLFIIVCQAFLHKKMPMNYFIDMLAFN